MNIAVYTGSFDPVTLGHLDVIARASKLVDTLVVGIGHNSQKKGLFTPDERLELLNRATTGIPNLEVKTFSGLAVNFVEQCGASVAIRGVRPMTDIAGEFTMMMANRKLNDQIETIFLMADHQYAHVSSSLIKQLTPLATDEQLAKFVPECIIPDLRERLK